MTHYQAKIEVIATFFITTRTMIPRDQRHPLRHILVSKNGRNKYIDRVPFIEKIQASLDLKPYKCYLKKSENPRPLHSPTCKHVVLFPGFE